MANSPAPTNSAASTNKPITNASKPPPEVGVLAAGASDVAMTIGSIAISDRAADEGSTLADGSCVLGAVGGILVGVVDTRSVGTGDAVGNEVAVDWAGVEVTVGIHVAVAAEVGACGAEGVMVDAPILSGVGVLVGGRVAVGGPICVGVLGAVGVEVGARVGIKVGVSGMVTV